MSVILFSGPIGAGKTTVARELVSLLPPPVSYLEGDSFWSFFTKRDTRARREQFWLMMRSMTVAAVPFAKEGYSVIVDFSIPPDFIHCAEDREGSSAALCFAAAQCRSSRDARREPERGAHFRLRPRVLRAVRSDESKGDL
jgi:hypothetical protein